MATPTIEKLTALLNDPEQSKSEKDRAAEILQWIVDRKKADPTLCDFQIEIDSSILWEMPHVFQLREVDGKKSCVRVGDPHRVAKPKVQA
ncbi:MAG: hypothetical protein ACM3WP_02145 [Acidobacteriota bacterium]